MYWSVAPQVGKKLELFDGSEGFAAWVPVYELLENDEINRRSATAPDKHGLRRDSLSAPLTAVATG